MSKLKMPEKGKSAAMMAALQAEHATSEAPPPQPPAEPEAQAPQEVTPDSNITNLQAYNITSLQPTVASSPLPHSPAPEDRAARLQAALDRAATGEMTVVTVRISAALNRYIDSYVARMQLVAPGRKYRKQDAITEALAAFYADHPMPPLADEDEL